VTVRARALLAASLLTIAIAVAGCGRAPAHVPGAGAGSRQLGAPSGVLPAATFTSLSVRTTSFSAADAQQDTTARHFAARLASWGYLGGWQRTFQGESRQLTLVVSRSMRFRTARGARAFVAFLHGEIGKFYPFALSRPISGSSQDGWLIEPPMCSCHMATPLLAAVTERAGKVSWLEINGPVATSRLLLSLLGLMARR
jgi:hypothetical protein